MIEQFALEMGGDVRVVRCRRGSATVSSRMALRPDYARSAVELDRDDDQSMRWSAPGEHAIDLLVSSSHEIEPDGDVAIVTMDLNEGDMAFAALGDGALDEAACRRYDEAGLRLRSCAIGERGYRSVTSG